MIKLNKLIALEQEAQEFGFKWDNPTQIMEQIRSECEEINEQLALTSTYEANKELQIEIGDLLHAVFSLTIFCKLDPSQTLNDAIDKFDRRFHAVKSLSKKEGYDNLHSHSFKELMKYWDSAKKLVG